MMYDLYYQDILSMSILAKNENDAWEQIKKIGIQNHDKRFKLKRNMFEV